MKQFPVLIEATEGEPVPGEGKGGVSVLIKPLPEATTMKTWSFLKESMLKIGDQVAEILAVRRDMAMLQQDLTAQEKLWHHAEIELNEENGKLKSELERLQAEVKAGENIRIELTTAEQALADEQRRGQDLINQLELQAKEIKMQRQVLTDRKHNLTAFQQKVNETASKEISRAEGVHLQLHKDAATLNAAIDSFMDRISSLRKEIAFEQSRFTSEYTELQRQLAAMIEGKKRIEGKLKPRQIFEDAERSYKEQLHQETLVILQLQSEYQQIVTECMKMMQQLEQVKCAENAKFEARVQEKASFCNSVQAQHQVLEQDLRECYAFFGTHTKQNPAQALPPPLGYQSPVQEGYASLGYPSLGYQSLGYQAPSPGGYQVPSSGGYQAPSPGGSVGINTGLDAAAYDNAVSNRMSMGPSLFNIGR